MPRHHVERAARLPGRPQTAAVFFDDLKPAFRRSARIKSRGGGQKVARIGQAIGANRPEFGQAEMRAIVLAQIAA